MPPSVKNSGKRPALQRVLGKVLPALALLAAICLEAAAQDVEKIELGLPNFRIHSTQEIGTTRGSRFAAIDTNGRILFSSNGELSAYDGTEWRRVSVARKRSNEDLITVAKGPDGTLYAGGLGYWGKLVVDEQGRYVVEHFASPEEQHAVSIEYFEEIAFNGGDVYFKGSNNLVRWHPQKGSRIVPIINVDTIFSFKGHLYASNQDGLLQLEDEQLVATPDPDDVLSPYGRIICTAKWDANRMALFSTTQGLVLFDGTRFEDIEDEFESENTLTWANDMERLDEDNLVVTVVQSGLHFVDRNGKTTHTLDRKFDHRFLDSDSIAIAPDKSIWVTLSDGIVQIQAIDQITYFDQRLNLPLHYYDHGRVGEDLVIRTNGNLFKAQYSQDGRFTHFVPFDILARRTVLEIFPFQDGLLASTDQGVYLVQEGKAPQLVFDKPYIYRMCTTTFDGPQQVVFANSQSTYITEFDGTAMRIQAELETHGLYNKILDDEHGDLWLERGISNIGRISRDGGTYSYTEYSTSTGLAADQWIPIWRIGGEVMFSTDDGPYRFNRATERFELAPHIDALIPEKTQKITRPAYSPKGDLWVIADQNPVVLRKQPDGSFEPDYDTLRQLGKLHLDEIHFENEGDTVWLKSQKVLARVDDSKRIIRPPMPAPKIDSISDLRTGQLLSHFSRDDLQLPSLFDYENNNLEIQLSTSYYKGTGGIKYTYRLAGDNESWSDPTTSSTINLDRIPTGSYQFQAKAIAENGEQSPATHIAIQVAAPFYRTVPAYLLYAAGLLGIVYLLTRLRHKKLMTRQRLLEEKVDEQTRALRDKNIQIHGAFLSERELKKRAEKANLAKNEFLATVSHEIRTPMNCIIGMADHLLATPLQKDQFKMLRAIHSSGQSLVAIIADILDFSKIEAGKIELENIPFSPIETVNDVFNLFVPSCREKRIDLQVAFEPELPAVTVGDPTRVKQVLINLIGNAYKFTERGKIEISLRQEKVEEAERVLHFTVSDSGIGIDADKMDLLFKAFSQVDSSNTRRHGGTGLGLVISKRLAKQMQGDITVSSIPGQGSVFSFSIRTRIANQKEIEAFENSVPRNNENVSLPITFDRAPSEATSQLSDEAKDVLLVEDNPINQEVTGMMLRRIGYSYDVVGNGEQACDAVAKKSYQIILMDIQMPEMDGFECARRLHSQHGTNTPPILAVTAKNSEIDRTVAREAGMRDFLTKPLERAKLKQAIQNALQKQQT